MNMALKLGCLLLVFNFALILGRTIKLEKLALTLTQDTEDDDLTQHVLSSFFGTELGVVELAGCKDGKCTACAGSAIKACFVATLETNSINLQVTVNDQPLLSTTINVPNPPPVCKDQIPGFTKVKDVCVSMDNIDLKKGAGCVYISAKVKLGPIWKSLKFKIGCFSIKASADDISDHEKIATADVKNDVTEHVDEAETKSSEVDTTLFFHSVANKN